LTRRDIDAESQRHTFIAESLAVATGFHQNPFADLIDERRFFRKRDELAGRNGFTGPRVSPAYQYLCPDDVPAERVNLRLKSKRKLLLTDSPTKTSEERLTMLDLPCDAPVVSTYPVRGILFAMVHGGISASDKHIGLRTVFGVDA
jgi:hypothetical protein